MQLRESRALLFPARRDGVPGAENGGELRLLAEQPHRLLALLGFDAAGEIEGIVRRAEPGHRIAQLRRHRFLQLGNADASRLRGVRGDLADAAGVRDDAQTAVPQYPGARGDVRGREQFLDRPRTDDAELAADAVEHAVVADERAGVGRGRSGRDLARADLENDDRLARAQGPSCRFQEPRRIAHRLDEEGDRARMRIVDQEVHERARIEVGLVSGRNHVAQAEVLLIPELGQEERGRSALRDDGDTRLLRRRAHRGRPGLDVPGEVDEAKAVRTEQPDAVPPRAGGEFRLQRRAGRSRFGESGGQHHRRADAGSAEAVDRLGHRRRGDDDDPEIEAGADRGNAGGGGLAVHGAAAPVHQVHRAAEAAPREILEGGLRPARLLGGADDHDRPRPQQRRHPGHRAIARRERRSCAFAAERRIHALHLDVQLLGDRRPARHFGGDEGLGLLRAGIGDRLDAL